MLIDLTKIPKGWHLKRLGSDRARPTGKDLPSRHLAWICSLENDRDLFPNITVKAESMQHSINWAIKKIEEMYPGSIIK